MLSSQFVPHKESSSRKVEDCREAWESYEFHSLRYDCTYTYVNVGGTFN